MSFNLCYIPVGVPTFELNSARKLFGESIEMLKSVCDNVSCPNDILLSVAELKKYLENQSPDCIVFQNNTFANSAYCSEVIKRFDCPIMLWTLREPVIDGTRLRLNSLTGAYSAGNVMTMNDVKFEYIFGSPSEVKDDILSFVSASSLKVDMNNMTLAQIGHTPEGFGFGRGIDSELLKYFNINLLSVEAREIIEKAKNITDNEIVPYLDLARKRINCLDECNEKNKMDFSRLYKAYSDFVKENNITALASRCWPDFFTSFGTPVCSVLSMLNDEGIASSCEADVYGALSMYIGMKLSSKPTFFGDPVSLDEKENTLTFWHCGTGATSLADEKCGANCSVHCNRKIGPTLDFKCKTCENITVFRVGRNCDGTPRFLLFNGSAIDTPKQFSGTSVVVKTNNDVKEIVNKTVLLGFEPHYAVIYKDCKKEIKMLSKMLGIEVVEL